MIPRFPKQGLPKMAAIYGGDGSAEGVKRDLPPTRELRTLCLWYGRKMAEASGSQETN